MVKFIVLKFGFFMHLQAEVLLLRSECRHQRSCPAWLIVCPGRKQMHKSETDETTYHLQLLREGNNTHLKLSFCSHLSVEMVS